jgi:shikimate kinase
MLIFIIGYMGAGKTTLGKQFAARLQYHFYDMDEMFEIATGYSIDGFFEEFGEEVFRLKEREILLDHLEDKDIVIATGGGTACYSDNMAIMNRLAGKMQNRPLLKNIPHQQLPAFIHEQMNNRREFYLKALMKVDGENVDLDEIVDTVRRIC